MGALAVEAANEKSATDHVADEPGNDSFVDVCANRDGRSLPDTRGHEEHVRNDVVEAERHECECWPPNAHHFGRIIAPRHAEVAGKANFTRRRGSQLELLKIPEP